MRTYIWIYKIRNDMKKYILVTLFTIGLINASILASSPINEENENKKTVYNIEKANATYAEGQIYFNITMDNIKNLHF